METKAALADDPTVIARILDHIDNDTTDLGETTWREPVANYLSEARFAAERELFRRLPHAFCPSAALPSSGSFVARVVGGTSIFGVRGSDGEVRAFRNACRHRGTEIASGAGCVKAFVCRYHGWTYGLDGRLRHVPDEEGFPGIDKSRRGLVPLAARERQGVVFVAPDAAHLAEALLDDLPLLIPPRYRLVGSAEIDTPANWKVVVEGFLEGYHIRSTHPQTFYPIQYDNLNVIEHFGRNTRIAFPYQAIEKLRDLPPEERSADGKLTYVYHLFPAALVATFPGRIILVMHEPTAIDATRTITYLLTDRDTADTEAQTKLAKGRDLVTAGAVEDREIACAIQRSIASGANEFFEFGLFERAIGHFHRTLSANLPEGGRA